MANIDDKAFSIANKLSLERNLMPFQIVRVCNVTLPQAIDIYDAQGMAFGQGGKGMAWLIRRIKSILKTF